MPSPFENIARKNLLRKSKEAKGMVIKGYDFNQGINYEKLLQSYVTTGFQASLFADAIKITSQMIDNNATIFLGYTSNMVSSGLRDVFCYLVQHKKVNFIVTTAGGIEEDLIKCLGEFTLGDFHADGALLRKEGINRIGNIFAPNNRYVEFEQWLQPLLLQFHQEQKNSKQPLTPSKLIHKLGLAINNSESICYWAAKNNIPIFCPAITDGALGDNIYFFSLNHPDFTIDIVKDTQELNNSTIGLKKSGLIILGSGVIKHSILNANMLRNGADYAVFINTAQEFDGSDAGAQPDEAVSWGKLLPGAHAVKVTGDATILFPLLVSQTFASASKSKSLEPIRKGG